MDAENHSASDTNKRSRANFEQNNSPDAKSNGDSLKNDVGIYP